VNENVAVRFNAMYENSDTFRDYGHPERYGFNPTVTLKPDDDTKIKLSYEFYHDFRLVDRGQSLAGTAGRCDAFQSHGTVRTQIRKSCTGSKARACFKRRRAAFSGSL